MELKIKNILLLIFICLTLTAKQNGNFFEPDSIIVQSFSFEKGISQQTVYDVFKDSKGFLWFGTMYGLIHYMGSNFEIYRHDPDDKNTLSSDDVTKIFEDRKGNIWIATFGGGFNKIDLKTNSIKRYTSSSLNLKSWNNIVWDIKEDYAGNIFVATENNGVLILNPDSDSLIVPKVSNDKYNSFTNILNLCIDSKGCLYADPQGRGLFKYNYKTKTFDLFEKEDLPLINVNAVAADEKYIWIKHERELSRINIQTDEIDNLSSLFPSLKEFTTINKIFIDSHNNIWLGGLNRVDIISSDFKNINTLSPTKFGDQNIHHGMVIGIVEDNSGVIWIGSYRGGISKVFRNDLVFQAVNFAKENSDGLIGSDVKSILPMNENELLIATNKGLSHFNRKEQKFENYFENQSINSLVRSDKNFWMGTANGLYLLDENYKVVKEYKHNASDTNSISSNYIITLLLDNENYLWVGTSFGLNRIDLRTNKVKRFIEDKDNPGGINGNTILSVYKDSRENIWIGTYSGLNRYDPSSNTFKLYRNDPDIPSTISNNYVFAYWEDDDNNLLIATGGGLNIYDRETETFIHYTEKDGLSNSVIFGIVEQSGYLFLSTAHGISVFNLSTKSFSNFNSVHGLHGNMFNARAFAAFKDELYFGGMGGLSIIDSQNFFKAVNKSKVVITSVQSIETDVSPNTAYEQPKFIEFSYDQNYVKFRFSSLDFRNTDAISYKYRLVGFDTTWMSSGNYPFAEYATIPPGEYTFVVNATNSAGLLGTSEASINVIVTPPFWQTWWFVALALFAMLAVIYFVYRYRLYTELKRAEEIERIRDEEEKKLRKKAAEDFHDELGHRITKISLYSELLKRTISDQESGSQTYLRKISDISSNLSTGVKDFIWTLDPGKDTLYDVAVRLKDFGDDLFDKSNISFRTSGIAENYDKINMPMDWRRHTILIFKEAMNNILKYSNAKNVLLSFTLHDSEIDISLEDDGDGFDIEKIKLGRGLKNIRMRAASVNGKVDIESIKGEGTSIRLHSHL